MNRNGQSLLELTLLVPLLISILVAGISFGKWFLIHQKLLIGARQAAMLYSSGRVKKSETRRYVMRYLTAGHPSLEPDRTTVRVGRWKGGLQAIAFQLDEVSVRYVPTSPLLRIFGNEMEEKCVIKHAPHYGPLVQPFYGPAVPW